MLSVLIVAEDSEWYRYRELEECLINDYYVEYAAEINPDVAEISKIEFSYEILFFLKRPTTKEIPAVSRLAKNKVLVYLVHRGGFAPIQIKEMLPVSDRVLLSAAAMRGRIEYFRGVDKIAALNAYHIETDECEIVLNGNRTSKAMLGDIAVRTGKNVVLAVRKDNIAVFSADVFSNDAMREGDNCRFIRNLLSSMVGGAEVY